MLLAQRRQHGGIAGQAADQEHPLELALAFLQKRDHLARHAVVQRVQNVLRRGFIPVELVGDVGFAVYRAAGSQRHHPARKRTPDSFLEAESHPANLLHKKPAAAGGALVVREHVDDPLMGDQINQERLAAQRNHGVETAGQLAQRPLDGGHFRKVAPMAGHPEKCGVGQIGAGEHGGEHLQRPAQMRPDLGDLVATAQRDHLDRERANIDPHASHRVFFWQHRVRNRVGVIPDGPT